MHSLTYPPSQACFGQVPQAMQGPPLLENLDEWRDVCVPKWWEYLRPPYTPGGVHITWASPGSVVHLELSHTCYLVLDQTFGFFSQSLTYSDSFFIPSPRSKSFLCMKYFCFQSRGNANPTFSNVWIKCSSYPQDILSFPPKKFVGHFSMLNSVPSTQNVHVLIPRTWEYVTLPGKGEWRVQMELRLLISWPEKKESIQEGPV